MVYRKYGSGRYISYETEAEIEIDLYDLIEDIVTLYNIDKDFQRELEKEIERPEQTIEDFIYQAKKIRNNGLLWERVKHDLKEIVKEDYVVVM